MLIINYLCLNLFVYIPPYTAERNAPRMNQQEIFFKANLVIRTKFKVTVTIHWILLIK